MNAVVGFFQERKADNAIELLKKRLALRATILRDDGWGEIETEELVPGDVVQVKLGNIVPADIKLIQGDYLMLDESALTGESLPVEKGKEDLAYSGSIVRKGRDEWPGLCHWSKHFLREDIKIGWGGKDQKSLPEGDIEDRRLPDHYRHRFVGSHSRRFSSSPRKPR